MLTGGCRLDSVKAGPPPAAQRVNLDSMVPNRAGARRGLPKTAKGALENGKEIPRPGPTRLVSISQAVGLLQARASTMRLATSRDRNDDGCCSERRATRDPSTMIRYKRTTLAVSTQQGRTGGGWRWFAAYFHRLRRKQKPGRRGMAGASLRVECSQSRVLASGDCSKLRRVLLIFEMRKVDEHAIASLGDICRWWARA